MNKQALKGNPAMGFGLLFLAKFLSSTVYGMFNSALVGYALAAFACDSVQAGLSVSVFVAGSLISRPLAGRYVGVSGTGNMLALGFGLYCAATLLTGFAPDVMLLMAVRFVQGMAFGIIHNTVTVAVAQIVSYGNMGREMGFFSIAATLSSAAGPFLGIGLQQNFDANALFLVSGVFSLAALICVLTVARTQEALRIDASASKAPVASGRGLAAFFDIKAVGPGLMSLACCTAYASITAFLNVYLTGKDLAVLAAWYFMLYPIVNIPLRPLLGSLIDAGRGRIVVVASMVCLACGMGLLACVKSAPMLVLSSVLVMLGYGGAFFGLQTKVVKDAAPERRGVAVSTMGVLSDLGMAIGPAAMGLLEGSLGYGGTYAACGAVVLVCALGAIRVYRS